MSSTVSKVAATDVDDGISGHSHRRRTIVHDHVVWRLSFCAQLRSRALERDQTVRAQGVWMGVGARCVRDVHFRDLQD